LIRAYTAIGVTLISPFIGQFIWKNYIDDSNVEKIYPPTAITSQPQPFMLRSKSYVTHNVRRFRFELPGKNQSLGILPGQHILAQVKPIVGSDQFFFRPYSPTTSENDKGYFDLVVKIYDKDNDKYPNGGNFN
jgi:hypothetical protein